MFHVAPLMACIFLNLYDLLEGCHVEDFNARSKCLTATQLQQGYRYHKLRKASLLHQCLSELEFYGDLVQIQEDYFKD